MVLCDRHCFIWSEFAAAAFIFQLLKRKILRFISVKYYSFGAIGYILKN